jgi:hypothetical protein
LTTIPGMHGRTMNKAMACDNERKVLSQRTHFLWRTPLHA